MKKSNNSGLFFNLNVYFFVFLFTVCFITNLHAQDTSGNIRQDLSNVSEDELSVEDPSPEKAEEAAEKKQSLEELLAVPFNQIKEDQAFELGISEGDSSDNVSKKDNGEVKLPPPPQQRKVERDIERKLDKIFREKLPKEYVGVSVSIRYILETVPVTKQDKKISKIKLPGFENNVWVPTQSEKIVGIVNQVRPYTTIFAVVNTPVSLFNVEVLRQTLDERVKFLNLTGRDVLKFVHVPFTTPAKSFVKTLDNAAEELAEEVKEDIEIEQDEIAEEEPLLDEEDKETAMAETEEMPEAVLEPAPEPRRIDLKARVETTRYLLQARKAYMKEDYDAAITALRRAIELNPLSSQAFAMLGSIYYRLGWNRMAMENWQYALELDPTNEGLKKYLKL
jgi:tetratricopeptide (TPR) repeat protein